MPVLCHCTFRYILYEWFSYLLLIQCHTTYCTSSSCSLHLHVGGPKADCEIQEHASHKNICNLITSVSDEAYRNNSLQTHIEVLLLVHFELLQDHPGFPNELVMSKLVFIAHRESDREQCGCRPLANLTNGMPLIKWWILCTIQIDKYLHSLCLQIKWKQWTEINTQSDCLLKTADYFCSWNRFANEYSNVSQYIIYSTQ